MVFVNVIVILFIKEWVVEDMTIFFYKDVFDILKQILLCSIQLRFIVIED